LLGVFKNGLHSSAPSLLSLIGKENTGSTIRKAVLCFKRTHEALQQALNAASAPDLTLEKPSWRWSRMKHPSSFLLSLLLHLWVGAVWGKVRFVLGDLQPILMRLCKYM